MSLPLYLVQAAATSAVAVAALLGAVFLRWPVRLLDIGVMAAMACGLIMLVRASKPSPSAAMPAAIGVALLVLLGVAAALAWVVARRVSGNRRTVVLGLFSGTAFAVLAIAGRPIADLPFWQLPLTPLAWLMVVAAVVGQALQAAALQQGSSTAAMAPSYAISTVLASVVGLVTLGDAIEPGHAVEVGIGLVIVLVGVAALSVGGHQHAGAVTPMGEERSSL